MTGWTLGERSGLSVGPAAVADALSAQRRRLLGYLDGLDDGAWAAPTRCAAWTVHHVTRHLVDTARIDAAGLAGRPPVFVLEGPFDPARTPDTWLAESDGQTPAETLEAYAAAIADEADALERRVGQGGSDVLTGPSGRPVHWSLIPLHIFWDAWLHERDVLVPSGTEPQCGVNESRLAAMYGLLVAAVPPVLAGEPLGTTVGLRGAPDSQYTIGWTDDEIVVTSGDGEEAMLCGEMLAVLDALMGRGLGVGGALSGREPDIERLSWLSLFMNPPQQG